MVIDLTPSLREDTVDTITAFLKHHVQESGVEGVIAGLSGGLDSAVVTKLCVDSLGRDKVLNVFLPDKTTSKEDWNDVRLISKKFGTSLKTIDISPIVEIYFNLLKTGKRKLLLGNIKARVRMTVLYHLAGLTHSLVIGTGNKSELLTGYFTKYGDGGTDILPLGDLYKTQVKLLARKIGIPKKLIEKVPTAGLWKGQTDEEELGIGYDDLDKILRGIELRYSAMEIRERTGFQLNKIVKVERMVINSVHKRKMPLIPKLGVRTIGIDWRE